jgi:hypothetical protein
MKEYFECVKEMEPIMKELKMGRTRLARAIGLHYSQVQQALSPRQNAKIVNKCLEVLNAKLPPERRIAGFEDDA